MEGSFRESEDLGHFVCGVYNIHGTNTVLGGVYGRSDNADIACARVMHELNNVISQLKQIFHTNQVIIAGDFNAGRYTSDFSSNQITKVRTSGQLESIIHDHDLFDLAEVTGKLQHTWHRRGSLAQSSRIDYILSSIPNEQIKFSTSHTIFDHVMLHAQIGIFRPEMQQTMKDFILGSEEFIIRATESIHAKLVSLGLWEILDDLPNNNRRQNDDTEAEEIRELYDHSDNDDTDDHIPEDSGGNDRQGPNNCVTEEEICKINERLRERNTTALQQFNEIIQDLQGTHNEIFKNKKRQNREKLKNINRTMNNLLQAKKRTNTEESRIRINERIANIQVTLANELEMKEKAMQTRINNFYKTNTGKMVPTTFNCIKEKVKSKDIQDIMVGGRQINKNEDIVKEMQNWYQETANNMQEQTMSLNEFLQNNNVTNLPQITEEHKTEKNLRI